MRALSPLIAIALSLSTAHAASGTAFAADEEEAPTPQRESPDFLAKVDRRPGILAPPSEVPTGDQAYLYEGLGEKKTVRNLMIQDGSDESIEE